MQNYSFPKDFTWEWRQAPIRLKVPEMKMEQLLGTANSGYYVRNAFSATKEELCQFIINWSKNLQQ